MTSRQPAQRTMDITYPSWFEFVIMTSKYNAISLGSGQPDDPVPKFVADILRDIADHPERSDYHQYANPFGNPKLQNILAKMYSDFYGREIDATKEILVCGGGYMALYYIFAGWINPGDQVIVLEPNYDCYGLQIKLAGGTPVSVPLKLKENATSGADFELDFEYLEAKCTEKTKILVMTNPGNPTGKMYTREDLEKIAEFAQRKDIIVIADEVYEWHVFGERKMIRFASLPGMFERTLSIGSAGKSLNVTGWRLGWMIGPDRLIEPARKVLLRAVFNTPAPTQEVVARAFEIEYAIMKSNPWASYLATTLPREGAARRDKMVEVMQAAGFRVIVPEGGYFILADISNRDGPFRDQKEGDSPLLDFRFCRWLAKEKKLVCLPGSAFYSEESRAGRDTLIRVCFMKKLETIEKAGEIFKTI